ncbi:hypothetical protein GPALN_014770 [Globodera pallida]|nr:hypothetical protein GPALN_014770 [Globodera pallida]
MARRALRCDEQLKNATTVRVPLSLPLPYRPSVFTSFSSSSSLFVDDGDDQPSNSLNWLGSVAVVAAPPLLLLLLSIVGGRTGGTPPLPSSTAAAAAASATTTTTTATAAAAASLLMLAPRTRRPPSGAE